MEIPMVFLVVCQLVVFVFWLEFFSVAKLVYDCFEFGQIVASLLGKLVIFLELVREP